MASEIIDLKCPGCGAPLNTSIKICEYCNRPIIITTLKTTLEMDMKQIMENRNAYTEKQKENQHNEEIDTSLGMCLLKLNMYEQASNNFEKIIEQGTSNSEVYFWNAVSLLKGKRPFLVPKSILEKAIEYANTARMLENNGIYDYFIAYIKYDYYFLKRLRITPGYEEELINAKQNNLTDEDIKILEEVLKVETPRELKLVNI